MSRKFCGRRTWLPPTTSFYGRLPRSLARPIYLKVNSVLHRQSVRPDVAPSHYRDERPTDRGPSESETAAGTGMGPPPHFTYGYGRPPFLCTRVEEDICGGIYSAHDFATDNLCVTGSLISSRTWAGLTWIMGVPWAELRLESCGAAGDVFVST